MLSANIYDRYVSLNLSTSTHTVAPYSCIFKSERLILRLSGCVADVSNRVKLAGLSFNWSHLCVFSQLVNLILQESGSIRGRHVLVLQWHWEIQYPGISPYKWKPLTFWEQGGWWSLVAFIHSLFPFSSFFPCFLQWDPTVKCWVLYRAKDGTHKIGKLFKMKGS